MKIDSKQYALIDFDKFHVGMYVESGIYFEMDGKLVLLSQQSVLKDAQLNKLKILESMGKEIYVEKKHFDDIIIQSKAFLKNTKTIKTEAEYKKLESDVSQMMSIIGKSGTVDKDITVKLCGNIEKKLSDTDSTNIIECINRIRSADEYLYTHSMNTGFLNGLMAKWLKLSSKETFRLINIGLLHDIGKLKIPKHILDKPSILTKNEFEIIKQHPVHSYDMLINSGEDDKLLLKSVRGHHEKLNGNGYPDRLKYDDITLYSRITSISDIYDAMVSKRIYKNQNSPFEILDEFARGKFSDLDIDLVNIFLKNMTLELTGKSVLLSNGKIAEVLYVDSNHLAFPIVRLEDDVLITNDKIKCVSMNIN